MPFDQGIPPHPSKRTGRLVSFTGLLVFSLGAHAQESRGEDARQKTAPYYQDAQLCRARSAMKPLPSGLDPSTAIDVEAYLRCINQLGYRQDRKTDPLLVGLMRCHALKSKAVSASGEVLYRAPSQSQMRVCLAARGFPSAGHPPEPNAASVLPEGLTQANDQKKAPPRPWESSEQDRVETVIIPPRRSAQPE